LRESARNAKLTDVESAKGILQFGDVPGAPNLQYTLGGDAVEAHGAWAGRGWVWGRKCEPVELFDRPLESLDWGEEGYKEMKCSGEGAGK
jgi:hypothetical protein